MQRGERIEHPQEALLTALDNHQKDLWTSLPGIIQSFNAEAMTVVVQPTIQVRVTDRPTNKKTWVNMPLLLDVPIVIQRAGGMSVTLPIQVGNECFVCFSSRCIDGWWQLGGIQKQTEFRMHDLSDGFAFLGPTSQPHVIANYSTTTMQIRSDDGGLVMDFNPSNHNLTITTSGDIDTTSTNFSITGKLTVTGDTDIKGNVTTTGTLKNNGLLVGSTHTHGGVTPGSGTTGVPT
jgi:hypothetical protein